jgi:hypothetical protein
MKGHFWGDGIAARHGAAEVAAEQEIAETLEIRERNAEIDRLGEAVIRLDDLLDAEMDIFAAP